MKGIARRDQVLRRQAERACTGHKIRFVGRKEVQRGGADRRARDGFAQILHAYAAKVQKAPGKSVVAQDVSDRQKCDDLRVSRGV